MEENNVKLNIKRALLIILIFILQTVFADRMRIFGISPNFALAYVMVVSYKCYPFYDIYSALILGFLLDAVSGRIFGTYIFLFVLISSLIKYVHKKLFAENFIFECMGGLFFNFLFSFLICIGEWIFYNTFSDMFLKIGIFEIIYNQIVFMIFLIISKKNKKKYRSIFRI